MLSIYQSISLIFLFIYCKTLYSYFYEVPTLKCERKEKSQPQNQAQSSGSFQSKDNNNNIPLSMTMDNLDNYRSLDADETPSSSSSESSSLTTSPSAAQVIDVLNYTNHGLNTSDDNDDDDLDLDPLSIRNLRKTHHLNRVTPVASSSSRFVNSRFFNSMKAPKLSLAFREANLKKISHKLSAHEIFSKFYHHSSTSSNLSSITQLTGTSQSAVATFRPTNISQTNKQLTKLLSQTKNHLIGNQSQRILQTGQSIVSNSSRKSSASSLTKQRKPNDSKNQESDVDMIEDDGQMSSFTINSQSSNDEVSELIVKLTSSQNEESQKRGRQADTIEHETNTTCNLSVIEERLDDSDSGEQQQQQQQQRTPSRFNKRTMERCKEIDMADGDQEREHSDAINPDIDDGDDDTSVSQASTIVGVKSLTCDQIDTLNATDSQSSVATLTNSEKTITTRLKGSIESNNLVKSQSLAGDHLMGKTKVKNSINSTESMANNGNVDTNLQPGKNAHSVKRSESLQNNNIIPSKQQQAGIADFKNSASTSMAANLTKSVGVMKAQQHLLQNLIRHQNQNLIPHLTDGAQSNRIRSVFIYPNLGEHQSEYPFVTFKKFPDRMIRCTGGVVSVHSVKLLDHIINDEESETRDIWWTEIRKEISCHAKALNCNTIIGYRETSKVISDVCILSAYGTAAIMCPSALDSMLDLSPHQDSHENNYYYINNKYNHQIQQQQQHHQQSHHHHHHNSHHNHNRKSSSRHQNQANAVQGDSNLKLPDSGNSPPKSHSFMPTQQQLASVSMPSTSAMANGVLCEKNSIESEHLATQANKQNHNNKSHETMQQFAYLDCTFCHTPLICSDSVDLLPNCSICKQAKVPEVLLLTIEPPKNLNIVSKAFLVQARVCRAKRDSHGEVGAKEIGEALPFLEYELHRQLFSKLKFKGLNCLFNLTVDISVGENMISGLATGSGCFVLGLAQPEAPRISGGKGIKTSKLLQIQRLIESTSLKNRLLLNMDEINGQLEAYHEDLRLQLQQQQQEDIATKSGRYGHKLTATSAASSAQSSSGSKDILRQESSPTSPSLLPHKQAETSSPHSPVSSNTAVATTATQVITMPITQAADPSTITATTTTTTTTPNNNLLTDENNIILEVDDTEDANIIALLIDSEIPDGYIVCNSESLPLIDQSSISNINMFTQVMRAKLTGLDQFGHLFDWILQALFVKLRRSLPCCLTNVTYAVDLPESNVVQVTISGCLLAIQKPLLKDANLGQECDEGIVINLDNSLHTSNNGKLVQSPSQNSMGSTNETSTSSNATTTTKSKSSKTSTSKSSSSTTTTSSSSSTSATNKLQQKDPKLQSQLRNTSTSASPRTSSSVSSSSESLNSSSSANDPRSTSKKSNKSVNAKTKDKMASSSAKLLAKGQANISSLLSASKSSIFNKSKQQQQQQQQQNINCDMEPQAIELSERNSIINKLDDMNLNLNGSNNNNNNNFNLDDDLNVDKKHQQSSTSSSHQLLRTVFKKQQTYPGAISPALSGQDPKQAAFSAESNATANLPSACSTNKTSSAARRATTLLNKVKQPLKDLGNSSINPNAASKQQQLHQSASTSSGLNLQVKSSSGQKNLQNNGQLDAISTTINGNNATFNDTLNQTGIGLHQNATSTNHHQHHHSSNQRHATTNQHHSSPTNSSNQAKNSNAIDITSLSYIPGSKDYHYLGNLSFSFVRETSSVRENGGLNGFIHCFLMEVFAIVRAHVSALGGNALLSLRLQQSCIWYHSNKNQAQCLIHVAGDAVQVVY